VLFADGRAGVVAAAHAGWKGALSGILENTIETMIAAGAGRDNIRAVLSPAIGRDSYEVGAEFLERFAAADSRNAARFTPSDRAGHFRFDLAGYILERLGKAGVAAGRVGGCTYLDEARFFSYRRSTH